MPSAATAQTFDFDLAAPGSTRSQPAPAVDPLRAAAFDRRVRTRRRMLIAHQAFGFATLGLLAATLVLGTLSYVDKYGAGPDDGRYNVGHLGLASATTASFVTTAMLGLLAPNPYPKPLRLDTALLHKISMALAAVCFTAQIVLGPVISASDGKLYQRALALTHLTVGYGAFAFMGAGTLAYVFK